MRYLKLTAILILAVLTLEVSGGAQSSPSMPHATFRARRDRAMQAAADGIILIRSRSSVMAWNEVAFRQDPTFYYLTGLANAVGALLVMDSGRHESWLFVPERSEERRVGKECRL